MVTAEEMLAACQVALPADVLVMAAAVADWRPDVAANSKIKKSADRVVPLIKLAENPDILATVAHKTSGRPALVIGFAAETERIIEHAKAKLARKGCDWIVANDVSASSGVMGGDRNTVHLLKRAGAEIIVDDWPIMTKEEVAAALVAQVAEAVGRPA